MITDSQIRTLASTLVDRLFGDGRAGTSVGELHPQARGVSKLLMVATDTLLDLRKPDPKARRERIALHLLEGLLAGRPESYNGIDADYAERAIKLADVLINKLDHKETP